MEKKAFEELQDDGLDQVTGGYLSVTEWNNYLSMQVMPVLFGLENAAGAGDKQIVNTIYTILQQTCIRGNAIADPVRNLWATYNNVYRGNLQSSTIKQTLDQTLYNAKQYIEQHS